MKKFIITSIIISFTMINAVAQTTAPIPSCACNNIAAQLNNGKSPDRQTQKEIEKMDEEANRVEKSKQPLSEQKSSKKHKWFWQR